MKHGPIALIDKNMPVVVIATKKTNYEKVVSNIQEIKSVGQKLDPNIHQAMMEIEDSSKEPGTVVQEIQKGFLMKDRLLRPSLVAVSKKSNSSGDNKKTDKKSEENQSKTTKK